MDRVFQRRMKWVLRLLDKLSDGIEEQEREAFKKEIEEMRQALDAVEKSLKKRA